MQKSYGIRSAYFYVDVTTARPNKLTELFDGRKLVTDIGTVLSLEDARAAHEMLADRQHRRGKIVLSVDSRSVESSNDWRKGPLCRHRLYCLDNRSWAGCCALSADCAH
jgi:hypothetical protein